MNFSSKSVEAAAVQALGRITARDRNLLQLLMEHDVFTSGQIAQIAFTGARRTNQRLAQLAGLNVLDRIRPYSTIGTSPYHWLLGTVGAYIAAADAGVEPVFAARRRQGAHELVRSMRRAHHVGCNTVFTDLIAASRHVPPAGQLEVWWSARRCAREWDQIVRPDGYGIWTSPTGRRLPFLLEYDTGTETLHRLVAKLAGYARLSAAAGHSTWLLFVFTSARRETHARTVLQTPAIELGLPIATAALTPTYATALLPDPRTPAGWTPTPPTMAEPVPAAEPRATAAGPVWLPLRGLQRRKLADLPDPDLPRQTGEPPVPYPELDSGRRGDR